MPNLKILRGLPGSGKSTIAKCLRRQGYRVCSADNFFTDKGVYTFIPSRLYTAHEWCFDNFCLAVCCGFEDVVIDNTNIRKKDFQRYVDFAKERGYNVQIIEVKTNLTDEQLAARNKHKVPLETIKRMRASYER